jgi:hypothetical protein
LVLTAQESEHATDRHIAIQRFRLGAILDGILEHALAMLVLCWMDHPSRSMGQRLKNRGGCFGSRSGGGYFGDSQAVRTIAISGSRPWTPYGVWLGRESAASRCYAGYLQYGLAARRSSRAVGCCMLIPSAILRADSEQVDRTRSDCECREK